MVTIIIFTIWFLFFGVAYAMQRTEMEADGETFTKGARALIIALSLLSVLFIIIMLIRAWVKMIGVTGYWQRPAKETKIVNADQKTTA